MRMYAFLIDNEVVKVESIDPEQYVDVSKDYNLVIDVEDLVVCPQVGWVLSGNSLVPSAAQASNVKEMIKLRIKGYQSLAPELLRDMYAQNTLLGITSSQSDAVFDDYSDVILRLQQGAFPTAIYRLQQKQPSGFVTQEMLDAWIATIQNYL